MEGVDVVEDVMEEKVRKCSLKYCECVYLS